MLHLQQDDGSRKQYNFQLQSVADAKASTEQTINMLSRHLRVHGVNKLVSNMSGVIVLTMHSP